ncbi:lipopolysaccharide-modifying protein [Artemisia annua]|uniref:Lipopolysaccharide-modifying protein n=1 Tax=Artemisia annua TaxID=35608 RepID=A0A2U1MV47_ARTAN|nr:lipopolysaccharide-modifying protein [Artemisia annua]
MDNAYDYMFHLLTAYSKIMKYKTTVPENATELCSETMACTSEGFVKQLMDQSTINVPANVSPYIMQPPYDPQTLNPILGQKANSIKQVEKWEKYYFEKIICCLLYKVKTALVTVLHQRWWRSNVGNGGSVTSAIVASRRHQWWICNDMDDGGVQWGGDGDGATMVI